MKSACGSLLIVLALLAGCSRASSATGGQVVAVVDGEELTTPTLESALGALPAGVDARSPVVQRAVVDQLVDEMLLSAAAKKQGLDRKPQTTRELARAQRMVLSAAYLRRTDTTPQPSEQTIVSYYSDHPYLFAERRRFRLHQVNVTGSPADVAPYLAAARRAGGSLDAVLAALAAKGVQSVPEDVIADADAFGPDLGAKMARLATGDTFQYRNGTTQTFARVDGIEPSPVPLSLARPVIVQLLQNAARDTAARQTVERLRHGATIDYGMVGRSILASKT